MKSVIKNFLAITLIAIALVACESDESEELDIRFKSGTEYVSASTTLPAGSVFTVGIEAETEKKKDPIIKFNISESVDGGANATVYSEDLETVEYEHDQTFTLDTISGSKHTYTFTITNRDGFNAQETLVVEVE